MDDWMHMQGYIGDGAAGATFTSPASPSRSRSGGKRSFCKWEACNKSFSTSLYRCSGHLARHMRLHYGEKKFKCDVCEMSFFRNDNLT
ncbi:hypothetical protein BC830DRAFT_405065 [Chytriomyces sp. MP71]|nr:hypothetical protein BC830DRAFT_405065 [Chytriomyces sp. MP71]